MLSQPKKTSKIFIYLLCTCLFLLKGFEAKAEGSKQLMKDTSSRAALCTVDTLFATYKSSERPATRLNIHIANPAQEIVRLGFSRGFGSDGAQLLGTGSTSTPTYYFRIKDPSGNIVFGPQAIDITNAIPAGAVGYQQILAGPKHAGNMDGYDGFTFSPDPTMPAGDYYIEFSKSASDYSTSQISFDYWDISVVEASTNNIKNGRIWSQQWGFFSRDYLTSTGTSISYSGRFKGQLYTYTDEGLVEKVSFGNTGFRGGSFRIGMNSKGPGESGDLLLDRKSIYKQNKISVGYKLFLNNPDETIYPTGSDLLPTFAFEPLKVPCGAETIKIKYTLNRKGAVEILLDFNGNGNYDAGTRDVLLLNQSIAGLNEMIWDRKDGLGATVSDADLLAISVTAKYSLGEHHLTLEDIEYMDETFSVTKIRPQFSTSTVTTLYWDDAAIAASAGLQVPYTSGLQPSARNFSGATIRTWNNFIDNNTVGFGNKNSINTWWNMYAVTKTSSFVLQPCIISISGSVLNDANGLKGAPTNTVDGPGTNAGGLYASLIHTTTGTVIASSIVNTDGTYNFSSVPVANYNISISTLFTAPGEASAPGILPSGWVSTGENLGIVAGNDGAVDGILSLGLVEEDLYHANFGIQQLSRADDKEAEIASPNPDDMVTLDGIGAHPPYFTGADPEDQADRGTLSGKTVAITSLPVNGLLYYNGAEIVTGQDQVAPPSATNPFVMEEYNPASMQIKFTGSGYTSVNFQYAYVDAAGFASPVPAQYKLSWGTPLPVTLKSFTGTANGCAIQLQWETAQETNFSHFEITFSEDGNTFSTVGKVNSKESVSGSNYSFDLPENNKGGFFRLRMVDKDLSESFSKTIRVVTKCQNTIQYSIAPKPATDKVYLNGAAAGDQIIVIDVMGRQLIQQTVQSEKQTINIAELLSGQYQLILISKGKPVFNTMLIKK